MKSIDAMFVWTPNTEEYSNNPLAGTVAVTTIPEPAELLRHPSAFGACNAEWHATDEAGRILLTQELVTRLAQHDRIDPASLRLALAEIEEFRNHTFKV